MDLRRDLGPLPADTAACLGAFDGMHLGHQALVRAAAAAAPCVAVAAFEPHPARVLRPDQPRLRLQSEAQRARVCGALGVQIVVRLPFDRRVASLEPEAFIREFITEGLAPSVLVVGEDFRFGHDRSGDADRLRAILDGSGSQTRVEVVGELRDHANNGKMKVGSTRIRKHLLAGELEAAARMLSRFHAVEGTVAHGAGRGRTLGFPTANVEYRDTVLPPAGVYSAVLSVIASRGAALPEPMAAVANLGTNPTFTQNGEGSSDPRLEVHALDRDLGESLYGCEVEVAFVHRIRDERRFSGPEALTDAIAKDAAKARAQLDDEVLRRIVPPRIVSPRVSSDGSAS